jgi:hypothetical protein
VFVYGLAQVGLEPMRDLEAFVAAAKEHDPAELLEAVKHSKDKVHPKDLDEKWHDGMDKEDFAVAPYRTDGM